MFDHSYPGYLSIFPILRVKLLILTRPFCNDCRSSGSDSIESSSEESLIIGGHVLISHEEQ